MSTSNVHTVSVETGAPIRIVTDDAMMVDLQATEPDAFVLNTARAVVVDGRWYTVTKDCPDDGFEPWSNELTAEEAAKEEAIASLTEEQKEALGYADYQTREERVAQKQADDAEAEARAKAAADAASGEAEAIP